MKENYKLRSSDFRFWKGYNAYNERNPETGNIKIDRKINDTAIFLATYNSFLIIGTATAVGLGLEKIVQLFK